MTCGIFSPMGDKRIENNETWPLIKAKAQFHCFLHAHLSVEISVGRLRHFSIQINDEKDY